MAVESTGFIVRSQSRPRKKLDKPKAAKTAQKKVKLTVSIGVAERNGNKHSTFGLIVQREQAYLIFHQTRHLG